jgi:large subunit GTPase 1
LTWLLIVDPQHTTETDEGPNWVKLQSVTQEGDLDAFLHTAELAGTEFTAGMLLIHFLSSW